MPIAAGKERSAPIEVAQRTGARDETEPTIVAQRPREQTDIAPAARQPKSSGAAKTGGILLTTPPANPASDGVEALPGQRGNPDSVPTPSAGGAGEYRPAPGYPMVPSYESRRYVEAQDLLRRRAVIKAEERRRRIELRKWLGYMPLRPAVQALPYTVGDRVPPTVILVFPHRATDLPLE
jgi:hypothetical protein